MPVAERATLSRIGTAQPGCHGLATPALVLLEVHQNTCTPGQGKGIQITAINVETPGRASRPP